MAPPVLRALVELRRASSRAAFATAGEALAFLLDAHEQATLAMHVRDLVTARGDRGSATSVEALATLQATIDGAALPDDSMGN